jgi:hypothetical protein
MSIVNSIADRHGFRRIEPAQADAVRGLGSREIVKRFGVPAWKIPFIANDMRKMKALRDAPLFPGIAAMLERLSGERNGEGARRRLSMISRDTMRSINDSREHGVCQINQHSKNFLDC